MNSWLRNWIFQPVDIGVKALAQKLRIDAFHIYEMLSRMNSADSRELLAKLNSCHSDEGKLRQAAIPFMIFKSRAPNSSAGERRSWQSHFELIQIAWNITDDELEIEVEFIPYFSYRK